MDSSANTPEASTVPLRPAPLPTARKPFDMAAHRRWFGEVCGANGRKIRAMIQGDGR